MMIAMFYIRNSRIFDLSTEIIIMASQMMKRNIREDSPQFQAPIIRYKGNFTPNYNYMMRLSG